MENHKRKILVLVEGKSTEVRLFKKIIKCFPEIPVMEQDILFYNTNLWALNNALTKEFGDEWYEEEIDFLGFLKSSAIIQQQIIQPHLNSNQEQIDSFKDLKFRDIFLVFDYERQDPNFNEELLKNMLAFWNESSENGLLYINYPMVEAYKHLKNPLPDNEYLTRICKCDTLFSNETNNNKYKQIVGAESSFTDLRRYNREILKEFVIHNLCKASYITNGTTEISNEIAVHYWNNSLNYHKILDIQNICSQDKKKGFVYVLATCLFFISEYNSKLIFE